MAASHVAGVVARYLVMNPCATTTSVASAIVGNATPYKVTNAGTGLLKPAPLQRVPRAQRGAGPRPCTGLTSTFTADYHPALTPRLDDPV